MANRRRVALPVEQMITPHARGPDQAIQQKLAEAGPMCDRQTNIFIEVKHLHLPPMDAGARRQFLEETDLRSASGRDDARPALPGNRIPKRRRGRGRSLPIQIRSVMKYFCYHDNISWEICAGSRFLLLLLKLI
jgi:hypothetical protein